MMIEYDLEKSMIEFLHKHQVDYTILPIQLTLIINAYLKNFWQGSTDKINWAKLSDDYTTLSFGETITATSTKALINSSNFKILNADFLVLYYSGRNSPILVDSKLLKNHLFELMKEFAFLNSILFFENDFLDNQQLGSTIAKINFIEVRIFDTLTGQL